MTIPEEIFEAIYLATGKTKEELTARKRSKGDVMYEKMIFAKIAHDYGIGPSEAGLLLNRKHCNCIYLREQAESLLQVNKHFKAKYNHVMIYFNNQCLERSKDEDIIMARIKGMVSGSENKDKVALLIDKLIKQKLHEQRQKTQAVPSL